MNEYINKEDALNCFHDWVDKYGDVHTPDEMAEYRAIEALPSVQPERKRMTNKEWIDFLSEQFDISRTSAREMLHGMMRWKSEDNFKKQFCGRRTDE